MHVNFTWCLVMKCINNCVTKTYNYILQSVEFLCFPPCFVTF